MTHAKKTNTEQRIARELWDMLEEQLRHELAQADIV